VLQRGSRWTADSINAQGLTFDPAFLKAMNTLSHISDVVFTNGEAGLHFELRPGTADGVMQTDLVIDSQKLVYMNQMPAWKRFSWPADTEAPGATLSWISTQAGTRQYADMSGAWGLIRLLDKATVSAYPGTGSSWSLNWKAPDGRALNYTLRTEAGEGPLALLKLRNFTLPEAIFTVTNPMEDVTAFLMTTILLRRTGNGIHYNADGGLPAGGRHADTAGTVPPCAVITGCCPFLTTTLSAMTPAMMMIFSRCAKRWVSSPAWTRSLFASLPKIADHDHKGYPHCDLLRLGAAAPGRRGGTG
jgi:hypothetical protein